MTRTIIFSLLLMSSVVTYSQEADNPSNDFEFLSGLTKAADEDLDNLDIVLDGETIPIYSVEGERVKGMALIEAMTSGNYGFDFYVDENKDIKVVHLKLASDEEKKEMLGAMGDSSSETDFIGKKAPPFVVTDIKGNEYNLAELEGKVVVLNFWFVEYKSCVHEIPELNNIVSEYKNDDVVFIGFATNRESKLTKFLEEKAFDYNIVPNCRPIASDYGISGYPTHIIIDNESTIVYKTTGLGATTIQDIKSKLNQVLGE